MKKQTVIISIVSVIVLVIACFLIFNFQSKENGLIENEKDMKTMYSNIYKKLGDQLPALENESIDVLDADTVLSLTGIKSNDKVESIVVSMPMMNAQAYLAATIKVKSNKDISDIENEILTNIDMNRWICVSAEKLYITNSGNTIFLIMSEEDWADLVFEEFKTYVNNNIGKIQTKENDFNLSLPEEIIVE